MTYGYIRVSSDKQTVENQRFEIKNFCKRQNMKVDGWIEETISGTKNCSKRRLGVLLKKVTKGDMIICSELSRLGRSLFMIMDILNICMNKECQVWTIKDNYRLGDDISSKVLARKKAEGKVLGRPRGKRCRLNPECVRRHDWIVRELHNGREKTHIAKRLNVSKGTFYRYLVYAGLHAPTLCKQKGWEEFGIYH